MIHVMAAAGLGGAAMAAPVMGYDAIAVLEEERHLRVPIIGRERPAVAEHDRLTYPPILVVNLSPVFRRNGVHETFSFAAVGRPRSRGLGGGGCLGSAAAATIAAPTRRKSRR